MTALQKEEINQLPKLVYYNIRGLGQPIRNLLYYFNIQFEDVRLERDLLDQSEQLESTFNSGLPKFQDDEITISDCVAIPIHLCQKFNHQELIGYTPRTKAKINQIMFKYWMEKSKMVSQILAIVKSVFEVKNYKKNRSIQMLEKMIKESKFISYCLKMHKRTHKWVYENLTIIDFFFYQICFYINGFFREEIAQDQYLNGFASFCYQFESLHFFQKNQKQIKDVRLFFPFKEEKNAKIIFQSWKGGSEIKLF